jgi:hypothetical protein
MARPIAARSAAWLVLASATALLGASCREMITDDVVDAEATYCDRLAACGLSGCEDVRGFFDAEEEGELVDAFLRVFAAEDCETGCGAAPICLDFPSLCVPPGEACDPASPYRCCGASVGESTCRATNDVEDENEAECCRPPGVVCVEDGDCCPTETDAVLVCTPPRGAPEGTPPTCGGVPPCTPFEEPCDAYADCCSRTCVEGSCGRVTCVPSGSACAGGDRCCSAAEACEGGTCRKPEVCPDDGCGCIPDQLPCDPGSPDDCCSDQCVATVTGQTFCGSPTCLPLGADCGDDVQCTCGGTRPDGACVEVATSELGDQKTCVQFSCEPQPEGACGPDRPCCAGLSCIPESDGEAASGRCQQACEASQCMGRSPQAFGVAIPRAEDRGPRPDEVDDPTWDACVAASECATLVCEADPFCCCFRWDQFCVDAAVELAGTFEACGP